MSSEIEVFNGAKALEITAENIRKYIPGTSNMTNDEMAVFLNLCSMYKLNPYKREIHPIKYGNNSELQIVVGYETFLKRAERAGQLNGWYFENEEAIETNGHKDFKVTLVIHRKDWDNPFKHTVYFQEVAQRKSNGEFNAIWKKMPRFMTKKVCISQGFRMCFPDEFGGMPYTDAEMGIETTEYEVIEHNGNGKDNKVESQKTDNKKLDDINEAKKVSKKLLQNGCDDGIIDYELKTKYEKSINDSTTIEQLRKVYKMLEDDIKKIKHEKELAAAQKEMGI